MSRVFRSSLIGESVSGLVAGLRRQPEEVVIEQRLKDEPVPEVVIQEDNKKFGREAKLVTTIFAMLVAGLLVTWYFWDEEYLSNNEDFIYNIGLIGGLMMLLQFVYALRKRLGKMRSWGSLRVWFGIHTFIGLAAPTIIVIHSRFDIQSINGGVAFFAMLLVVISGIVGRYLYSQTNFDLEAGRVELKKLHVAVQTRVMRHHPDLVSEIEAQLKAFVINAFANPSGVIQAFALAFSVGMKSKHLYWSLCQMRQLVTSGQESSIAAMEADPVFDRNERRVLKRYLKTLTRLARYNAFKQLYSLWRIGHVPVIYLLLVTGLAHVLAVHMY